MRKAIADYPHGYAGWHEVVMMLRRGGVHREVHKAIKRGELKLAKEQDCVDCGAIATCYDHRDYNKPLDVSPVCDRCDRVRGMGFPYVNRNSKEYSALLEKAKEWYNNNLNKGTKKAREKRKYVLSLQRKQRKQDTSMGAICLC
ncbi:MAG: hypothetical protein ACHP6H_07215 [Legionellales bacterium]